MAIDVGTPIEMSSDANGRRHDDHRSGDHDSSVAHADNDSSVADQPETTSSAAHRRQLLIAGVLTIVVLAALTGWLGYRSYLIHQAEQRHALFLQTARQGALNLTTISHTQVDADVQRILDSATGTFYDDFQQRSKPFTDVVRQAQSTSVGDITAAGVESETLGNAQVLVAVTVKTSTSAGPDQQPRSWRMRITVQRVDDSAKVANVEFVP